MISRILANSLRAQSNAVPTYAKHTGYGYKLYQTQRSYLSMPGKITMGFVTFVPFYYIYKVMAASPYRGQTGIHN